jgi:acetolactate synthase-1/2/3 large subunit
VQGGDLVAEVLDAQGVRFLFTLCGGHVSPILVGAKKRDIRIVDTRHEATAVFAADAAARLTGRPGVAVVTAGPGVTNTITAVVNARLAQSPVVLLGGAAPTITHGRGALQDIDQMGLLRPVCKAVLAARRVKDIVPLLEQAFRRAQEDVPGPVFVELPVDVLYEEAVVRRSYELEGRARSLQERAVQGYLALRIRRIFAGSPGPQSAAPAHVPLPAPAPVQVAETARRLAGAERPIVLVGSQALISADAVDRLVPALRRIGAPVFLAGTARGLLGRDDPLQIRHHRKEALREADLVLLAGTPLDFRLGYGRHVRRAATLISANRSRADLRLNRTPDIGLLSDASVALEQVADAVPVAPTRWREWCEHLRHRDAERDAEIARRAGEPATWVHPLRLCRTLSEVLPADAVLVADGGDIVASASYVLRPGTPLHWLDPGVFGTLGVGAGFALAAALVYPGDQVWMLFGDGAVGYSLTEFDTFVRHDLPVVAVVGNDASWSQIARDQVTLLHDDVATVLAPTRYDLVAAGFGALGLHVENAEELPAALAEAASAGRPALVDVRIDRSDFREGSSSL